MKTGKYSDQTQNSCSLVRDLGLNNIYIQYKLHTCSYKRSTMQYITGSDSEE